jgi:hypothetical protein
VGRDHSADGLGYGPIYYVSKYSMSTAYLATAHFKDQDALSARIIQARFTGHFRFACQAFLEFMSDPTLSGAGSNNPEASAFGNPDDFASPYDRNWIAMASALFAESYHKETGHLYPTGVHKFWQENCEEPAVHRSAMPQDLWQLDPKVYGEEDLFSHDVPVWSFAPLRAFGSLRQIRDMATGGDGKDFSEDYTNVAAEADFREDRGGYRAANSLHALYRERICNPTYKYSINDAIGNPPVGSNDMQGGIDGANFIKDASRAKLPRYDMFVPNGMLGASGIRRPHPEGCGLNIESGGCDPAKAPTYYDSSLWSWAYVTSSQCEQRISNQHAHTQLQTVCHRLTHLLACVCAATPTSRRAGTGCSTSRRSRSRRAAPTSARRASRRSTAPPRARTLSSPRWWRRSSRRSRSSGSGTRWPRRWP